MRKDRTKVRRSHGVSSILAASVLLLLPWATPKAHAGGFVSSALAGTRTGGFYAAARLDPVWAQLVNPAGNHINGIAVMHKDLLIFNYPGNSEGEYNKIMTVNRNDSNWQLENLPKMLRGKDYASGMDSDGKYLVLADTSRIHILEIPNARNPENQGISDPSHTTPGGIPDNIKHLGYVQQDGMPIKAEFVGIAFNPFTQRYYIASWRGQDGYRLFEAKTSGKKVVGNLEVQEVTLDKANAPGAPEGGMSLIFDLAALRLVVLSFGRSDSWETFSANEIRTKYSDTSPPTLEKADFKPEIRLTVGAPPTFEGASFRWAGFARINPDLPYQLEVFAAPRRVAPADTRGASYRWLYTPK